ncbi:MAG: hypothetical protein IPM38_03380 [Ignavibacteria bacterium]|nr:hypothetical protein [Ignavibacteria bacterium]
MATEVAVITAATGAQTFYSNYAAARTAATAGDKIQIWADLTNELLLLKDKVDIWIAPGRIIQMTDSAPIILDNDGGYTDAVEVNISGNGFLKSINEKYGCVKIVNRDSIVSITCDSMENEGYDPTSLEGSTIYIENCSKFYLNCGKIINSKQRAIFFENEVDDINIKAGLIQSGDYTGGDAVTIRGNGFLSANEIICNNDGSCLLFQGGSLIANILKLTTTNISSTSAGTVKMSGGTGTQELTLYFDEIQNLSSNGGDAVIADEGILNLIGRRIYCVDGLSLDLATDANIIVDEIISETKGINIHNDSSTKIVIDSNKIEGSNGNDGVIRSSTGSNYVVRNAKIKNTSTSGDSVCIYIASGQIDNDQTIEVESLILATGNTSSGKTIYRPGTHTIDVKNLGLFVNKGIDRAIIILKIGTGTEGNYKYIVSSDIS